LLVYTLVLSTTGKPYEWQDAAEAARAREMMRTLSSRVRNEMDFVDAWTYMMGKF
jgi:hypothetical protein